jgi:hypothetical protein
MHKFRNGRYPARGTRTRIGGRSRLSVLIRVSTHVCYLQFRHHRSEYARGSELLCGIIAIRLMLVMIGLVDKKVGLNAREVGECIYCGARDVALNTEHAIPYGLNGPWTLLRASCEPCAKITSRFEHDVMRRLWPDVRNALAMQSRRRDKRPPTLALILQCDGIKKVVQVPRAEYPTYLVAPLFPPPAILWSNREVKGVFANLDAIHLAGPTFQEASERYPGADFVGAHTNFSAEDFARTIAKIGFCAAVSALGLGAFTNTPIREIILGINPRIGLWVGSWWGEPINGTHGALHEIRVMCSEPGSQIHVFVRLFAQFGAPEYHVLLGPADRTFKGSGAWPTGWAQSDCPNASGLCSKLNGSPREGE